MTHATEYALCEELSGHACKCEAMNQRPCPTIEALAKEPRPAEPDNQED